MERAAVQIFLCLGLFSLFISTVFGNIAIRVNPPGPVKPGTTVKITCNVSKNYEDSPVTWLRKTASVEFQIARHQSLESTLYKTGRYILDTGGTPSGLNHVLEIRNVQFEDIGEIGCVLDQSTKNPPVYTSLIVCSNSDNAWCKCIKEKKWSHPQCGEESSSTAATNKRLKEGLGACLGIAIIYGIIVTILAGIDCSSRLHQKRLRAQKKAAAQAARNRNPYGDSEQLTLDTSDPDRSMNTSQDMRTTEPMRYPELSTQQNGRAGTPVKVDIHDGNSERENASTEFDPPEYQAVNYPRLDRYDQPYPRTDQGLERYPDAVNALANNYTDYRNEPQYDQDRNHRMEPLPTISQGYNRAQLPRNDNYDTPGKLSTHSADYLPQYNHINNPSRPNYANNRGAYSEQKPQQYGRQHPTNVEPRRLNFAHTTAAEPREPSAPYVSPDTSV